MTTVYTKSELENAIRNREKRILIKGRLAKEFQKRNRAGKGAKAGGIALIAGSLAALPFTGGASAAGVIAGAAGLTICTLTISLAELIVIFGGTIGIIAIIKGMKVTYNSNGSVLAEPQYK